MGRLYDMCRTIDGIIAKEGVDEYLTKGRISARAGFVLSLVKRDQPDDIKKIENLRIAVKDILGESI